MSDAELELRPRRVDIQDVAATGPTTRTHMRRIAPPAIWSVIAAFVLCMNGSAGAADRPPNIVLLLADDLGYGEIGPHAQGDIPTPHIDSLATNGVRFTAGYVTASYCSPSRAGLLTGRYQTRFGHERNPTGKHNLHPDAGLPLTERTIADHLHDAGYATALIGKWHLGGHATFHPQKRGFDRFFGFLHEGHFFVPGPPYEGVVSFLRRKTLAGGQTMIHQGNTIYATHMRHDEPPYDANNPILRGTKPVIEPSYLTDALTREAVTFIDRHKHEPFFLYLSYNAVHSPMQGALAYMEKLEHIDDMQRRVFAAMLANMDDSVGAVIRKLGDEGLEDDTLIFFISDNGGPTRELTSSNAPLRGGKGSLYEGGVRVPFIVQWKAALPAGKVYDRPVSTLDVLPTALAAARAKQPEGAPLDGVNLLPHLTGKDHGPPHEMLYWRMTTRTALRKRDWKIVAPRYKGTPHFELYNLADDLGEQKNLAETRRDKLAELEQSWRKLNDQMVEPVRSW